TLLTRTLSHAYSALTLPSPSSLSSLFFNDPPTTELYTLSLHDALPISRLCRSARRLGALVLAGLLDRRAGAGRLPDHDHRRLGTDRKSTRLTPVTDQSRMPSSA